MKLVCKMEVFTIKYRISDLLMDIADPIVQGDYRTFLHSRMITKTSKAYTRQNRKTSFSEL